MSGLRTRKYVTLVAVFFAGWSLIHISVNLHWSDGEITRNNEHSSSAYSSSSNALRPPATSSLLKSSPGYRKPSSQKEVDSIDSSLPPSFVTSERKNSIYRDNADTPLAVAREPPAPPDDAIIPPPVTILKPNIKYLSYMSYAGLTNQFMALENAAYIATRLNRTLIVPPIITNSHDRYNSNQRWSEFFDFQAFTKSTGVSLVEWTDMRPLSPEQSAIGKHKVRRGSKAYPLWNSLAENLTCQVIYGFGDKERLHTTENTFARQFLFKPVFVRPPHRSPKTPVYDRISIGAKDNIDMEDVVTIEDLEDRYSNNTDQLLFLSHTFKLKDPRGRGLPWEVVGRHLKFLPKVREYATRIIQSRAPETIQNGGRYIAIHLRRGDIWQKCRDQSEEEMMACITPLGHYAEAVEKARETAGLQLPVIVTTDSQDEKDHSTMAMMGWKRLNHEMYTTEQELGIFGAAMVDASILADADVMIGTYVSSMSRVAAWRQRSWHKRTVLYPRTSSTWTPPIEK
ncbi:hypothetical protein BG004_006994 [Podila humilis]|nr:hypothetical protein BG004_006994 [Podila humilis]